nr:MAG TPA: hypothetical protein [Caudoviricetes sp.]
MGKVLSVNLGGHMSRCADSKLTPRRTGKISR